MALIKNIHLLTDVSEKNLSMMEHAALEHKRYNNIEFKVVDYEPKKKITIQITQGKNAAGVYHNKKRLVDIVHETFRRFFIKEKILVHPVEHVFSPTNIVDDKWVNDKMLKSGIKLKNIAADTGIDYTQLSSLVSGDRPLSQPMKALFYYYFEAKGL